MLSLLPVKLGGAWTLMLTVKSVQNFFPTPVVLPQALFNFLVFVPPSKKPEEGDKWQPCMSFQLGLKLASAFDHRELDDWIAHNLGKFVGNAGEAVRFLFVTVLKDNAN